MALPVIGGSGGKSQGGALRALKDLLNFDEEPKPRRTQRIKAGGGGGGGADRSPTPVESFQRELKKPIPESKLSRQVRETPVVGQVYSFLYPEGRTQEDRLMALGMGVAGGKGVRTPRPTASSNLAKPVRRALAEQPPVVTKLMDALETAKPLRAEQKALYSAERAKRIAMSTKAGANTRGMAGLEARKAAFAGELPKVRFEPLKLAQEEMDELGEMVARNPRLGQWQVVPAMEGLKTLALGGVPQPKQLELLSRVFGSDVVSHIASKTSGKPITGVATAVAGLTRGLMTFMDFSFPFRQGLAAMTRHPVLSAKGFPSMIGSGFSKRVGKNVVDDITARPTFEGMQQGKLALPALSDYGLLGREEAYAAAQLAERIPIIGHLVKGSNRAYSVFATRLRADVFDYIVKTGPKSLKQMTKEDFQAVGSWVNTVTGRGELGRMAPAGHLLTTTIFAPRLIASRLSLINPRFYLRAAKNPVLRKESLTQAAALYGSLLTVLGTAKAAGARVETNPRSSDFGKIIIPAHGGMKEATIRIIPPVFGIGASTFESPEGPATRFEVSGGILPYIRLIAQMVTGEAISPTTGEAQAIQGRPISRGEIAQRFIENKFSPVASAVRDILYEDMRPEDYNVVEQIVSRVTPLIIQDWYELTQAGEETLGEYIDRLLRGGTDFGSTGGGGSGIPVVK